MVSSCFKICCNIVYVSSVNAEVILEVITRNIHQLRVHKTIFQSLHSTFKKHRPTYQGLFKLFFNNKLQISMKSARKTTKISRWGNWVIDVGALTIIFIYILCRKHTKYYLQTTVLSFPHVPIPSFLLNVTKTLLSHDLD